MHMCSCTNACHPHTPAGQALVDGVTAALYNVCFTSIPILLFAVLDRPVKHFVTLIRYPQVTPSPPVHPPVREAPSPESLMAHKPRSLRSSSAAAHAPCRPGGGGPACTEHTCVR